jgi:hypothetical protein
MILRAKHVLRLLSCGLLLAVLLSGCIEVKIESEFDSDLSARHVFETTIEKEALEQLQSMGGEDTDTFSDTEEIEREANEQGLDFERIENDERIGWRVSKRVEDSSDVGAALNEVFQGADPEAEPSSGGFSGTFTRDGDTFRLDLTVTSDEVFEGQEEDAEDLGMDMSQIITFVYIATMPGEVTETNGTKIGDNKVQWDIPLTGTTTLTAVSQETGGGAASSNLLLFGLIALLLIGGAVAAFLFMQRRRRPALGAAPASTAPLVTDPETGTATTVTTGPEGPTPAPYDTTPSTPADTYGTGFDQPSAGPDDETRPLPPRPAGD